MSDTRSMTYQEIAEAKGISVGGAKSWVRRQGLTKTAGNDGAVRVQVPHDADLTPTPGAEPEPDPLADRLEEALRELKRTRRQLAQSQRMLGQALRVMQRMQEGR